MNYGNVLEISLYRENDASFFSMDFFYCFLFYVKSFLFLFVNVPVLTHFCCGFCFVFELCTNGIPAVFWKSLSFCAVLPVGKMYNLCGKWYFRNKVSSVTSNASPCFASRSVLVFQKGSAQFNKV